MILFHIYKQASPSCLKAWIANSNDFSKCLSSLFHSLLEYNSNLNSPSHFNTSRDQFHDKLSMHNPESFSQFGMVGTSVTNILDHVFPPCQLISVTSCTNNKCNKVSLVEKMYQSHYPQYTSSQVKIKIQLPYRNGLKIG